MKTYLDLFIGFAKIGLLTFGGGYAMLPMLTRVCVRDKGWATEEELMDYYAIGQCTPGVIAVNTATFIGLKLSGLTGGIIATLGVIFPSLIIIMIIAAFLNNFAENVIVGYALSGMRIAVCALVTVSVSKLAAKSVKDIFTAIVLIISFIAAAFFGASPILVVVMAAAAGIAASLLKAKRKKV